MYIIVQANQPNLIAHLQIALMFTTQKNNINNTCL